jgi:hypothetical protein
MTCMRKLGLPMALVALVAANPAFAGPSEPGLVVEKLSDPDPGFVPPAPEKHPARAKVRAAEKSELDEAFENLGRVTGQAAQMYEQRARADRQKLVDMACKAIDGARASGMDVSRWEKDC